MDENDFMEGFRNKTCQCSKLYGSPCSAKMNFDQMQQYLEKTSVELDLTVKVQLAAHRKSNTYWPQSMSKKVKTKDRERVSQKYYFVGQQMCRENFLELKNSNLTALHHLLTKRD